MRLNVETMTGSARAALVLAVVVAGYRLMPAGGWGRGVAWNGWSHAALGYGLTGLGFAAFTCARRDDLTKIVLLLAAVVEVVRRLAGCDCGPWDFAADALGALAVAAPFHLERFRAAGRRPGAARFTLSVANDRRAPSIAGEDARLFMAPGSRGGV